MEDISESVCNPPGHLALNQVVLARLEVKLEAEATRLEDKIEVKITMVRGDIEQVQVHLGVIDNTLSTRLDQMGADISRLRSALYLTRHVKPRRNSDSGSWPKKTWRTRNAFGK